MKTESFEAYHEKGLSLSDFLSQTQLFVFEKLNFDNLYCDLHAQQHITDHR